MNPDCLKLKIWSLQCKFSELAEKYMNNMLLGISCPEQLDYLKTFRRALLLLNRNNQAPFSTINYTLSTYGAYSGVAFYEDEWAKETKAAVDPDTGPVAVKARPGTIKPDPINNINDGINVIEGTTSSSCATNIDIDTINKIIETLEKKY